MPSALGIEFLNHNAKQEEATHHSIKFSGLYCLASPESGFWRVHYGSKPRAYKVGKSVNVLTRLNEYALYYPFINPEMQIHSLVCMPYAQTVAQKSNVDRAETWVLGELKKKNTPATATGLEFLKNGGSFFSAPSGSKTLTRGSSKSFLAKSRPRVFMAPASTLKTEKGSTFPACGTRGGKKSTRRLRKTETTQGVSGKRTKNYNTRLLKKEGEGTPSTRTKSLSPTSGPRRQKSRSNRQENRFPVPPTTDRGGRGVALCVKGVI